MDNHDQNFIDKDEMEEDFEALLNQSFVGMVHLNPGEQVEVEITKIAKECVFVDIGGKSEGYIVIDEFLDKDGNLSVKEGDRIRAYFLSSKNNEMLFTTRLTEDKTGTSHLEEAYHNQIPVEGFVEKEIKGGFQVKIAGNTRAFCPYSQMDLQGVGKADLYIGQHLTFKIIEFGSKGRNIIISRRTILEEERQKLRDALRQSLKEEMTVSGKITSIRKFGAFVDIGGIEGLIPVSAISWDRTADINHSLSVGQNVEVVIKKLDWANNRFSFSLKETLPDPWNDIDVKYPEGSCHKGKVSRLAPFGAFVTLEPGIDGLVHISEIGRGKRINHPRDVLEERQIIDVKIAKLDKKEKRLSLSMVSDEADAEEIDSYHKYMTTGSNKSSGSLGTLGDLLKAKTDRK